MERKNQTKLEPIYRPEIEECWPQIICRVFWIVENYFLLNVSKKNITLCFLFFIFIKDTRQENKTAQDIYQVSGMLLKTAIAKFVNFTWIFLQSMQFYVLIA